ncbi:hypothetical protein CRYUN_Cryun32bG0009800 [Craigia yunnanensis]
MLTLNYELFFVRVNESIKKMADRFTDIINGLNALGKNYTNKEMVKNLLISLPKSWEAKVTVIEELKYPNNLGLDELIGSLITYEMKLKYKEKKEEPASLITYEMKLKHFSDLSILYLFSLFYLPKTHFPTHFPVPIKLILATIEVGKAPLSSPNCRPS